MKASNFAPNPKFIKLGFTGMLGSFALLLAGTTSAHAANFSATLTADNHYGLYSGQDNGSGLTLVGRNEKGSPGVPGVFNWSLPETYNFNANSGDRLYVLAWDDGGPQSWLGQFSLPGGGSLLSSTTDWEYTVAKGLNPGSLGDLPSLATVAADIATATWATPQASALQGSAPWGTIPGISSQANFIWSDTLADNSNSDSNYVIFRTKVAVVPVPETQPVTFAGIAVVGLMAWMTKRNRKAW